MKSPFNPKNHRNSWNVDGSPCDKLAYCQLQFEFRESLSDAHPRPVPELSHSKWVNLRKFSLLKHVWPPQDC